MAKKERKKIEGKENENENEKMKMSTGDMRCVEIYLDDAESESHA